jgi:hypothetical protein
MKRHHNDHARFLFNLCFVELRGGPSFEGPFVGR